MLSIKLLLSLPLASLNTSVAKKKTRNNMLETFDHEREEKDRVIYLEKIKDKTRLFIIVI